MSRRPTEAEELLREAIALAERLGWSNHPLVAVGYVTLGHLLIDRGTFEEGGQLLERAEPILTSAPEPVAQRRGMRPMKAAATVMALGRMRLTAPSWTAW